MRHSVVMPALLGVLLSGLACQRQPPPPPVPPTPTPVVNAVLGLAIMAVPEGFRVLENRDDLLVLARSDASDGARLIVTVGPLRPGGVDLVREVEAQPATFKGRREGTFLGSKTLRTPLGRAYTARGRYRTDAGVVEESRVLAVHPSEDRLLTVTYVYPPSEDVVPRIQQLLDVFAEIGPLFP